MSYKICLYKERFSDEWNLFVKKSKNGFFMFERNFMDYHKDRFEDYSLMFYRDNKLEAVLPANRSSDAIYSHNGLSFGGIIFDYNMKAGKMLELFESLFEFLKKNSIKHFYYKAIPYIFHQYPADEDIYALLQFGAELYNYELSSIIAFDNKVAVKSGKKSGISFAKRQGLLIKESKDFESFYQIVATRLNDKYSQKPTHTAAEMELLQGNFPENIKLLGCFKESVMLSGALLFITDKVVTTQYLFSSEEGIRNRSNDLLIDDLTGDRYRRKKYINFGISTNNIKSEPLNSGLLKYKEELGGRSLIFKQYLITL